MDAEHAKTDIFRQPQEIAMSTVLGTLDHVLLMAPGPSPVASNVLQAMSLPTLGHLDPDCIKVMDAIQGQ